MTGRTQVRARVAVIGTGVIGRSWMRVFTRAGCETCVWDPNPETIAAAVTWHDAESAIDARPATVAGRLVPCRSLEDALAGASYVQESGPESVDIKRAIFSELDRLAEPNAIVASSTSALDMTDITAGLPGARRCVVAHPVNPPHVVPIVEILGGRATDAAAVSATVDIMRAVGQSPVVLNFYVPGFLLNRMQAALVREAIDLLTRGVADADAIDAVIRDGLGLRWALMGPFGVANTNADGGVREYFTRYGPSFERLMNDLAPNVRFDAALIDRVGSATDAMEGGADREDTRRWRDRLVRRVIELKREDPHP